MPRLLSEPDFAVLFEPGQRVFVAGAGGHSGLFERWLCANPGVTTGVDFCGLLVPGINNFDFAGLDDKASLTTFMLAPALQASWRAGRVRHLPLAYPAIVELMRGTSFDLAMLQVSPPDERGNCSFGIAADFSPLVWPHAKKVVAHINPSMPQTRGPTIPFSRIDHFIEADEPLLEVASTQVDPATAAVAQRIAGLIDDGATLQFGLGRLQHALMPLLRDRRGLKIHSGMVSDGLLALIDAGALAPRSMTMPPVHCGVALGCSRLYRAVAGAGLVEFHDAGYTHAASVLRSLDGLISINSAIEVDLFGQVNAEMLQGKQLSGTGGLADFARGAQVAPNGRSIIALNATARGGSMSRIVAQFAAGTMVSLPRADVDTVVTEYGVASLRDVDVDTRARKLIAIAAPAHRQALLEAWDQQRGDL